MRQTAAKAFKGEEPAGLGGVGCGGRDRGEGQAAQWVADSIWKGREEKARLQAGTCHGHHGGCQGELLQPWVSSGVWDGHALATFPWALADSGAGPHWHAWLSQYTRATDTSGSLRANSLAQNNLA